MDFSILGKYEKGPNRQDGTKMLEMRTHPKMRVCLVTFAFPPLSVGGVSTQSYHLASHLSREGVEVHVLAAGNKDEEDYSNGLFKVTRLKIPFSSKVRKIPAFQYRVWRWLEASSRAFDVVHFQGTSGFIYLLCKKSHNVVQTYHHSQISAYKADLRFMLKSPNTTMVYLPSIALAFEEVLTLRIVKNIVAISNVLRCELLSYGINPGRINVIPNGVDEVPPSDKKEKTTHVDCMKFLFVGRLYPIKGIDTLMKAVKILSDKAVNNSHIDIVGDGPLFRYCEKEIVNNNLRNCSLLGAAPWHEMEKIYREADCLIFPSRHEGFGIVLLEAAVNGLAIIANDIPTSREIYPNDEVLYFKKDDPYDLAQKIIEMSKSSGLCASLQRKAHDRAKNYTWQNIVKNYVALYSRVISQQERGRSARR